jgi:hypothetical protein
MRIKQTQKPASGPADKKAPVDFITPNPQGKNQKEKLKAS